MTVELVLAFGITVYAIKLLICICACIANYRAGVRDGIAYLRDPSDQRYHNAGDLIESEGLASWLKQERLSRNPNQCDRSCGHTKNISHRPAKDAG